MKKGLILIICAGVMWGTSCVFVNLLSPYGFTSGQMIAFRFCIAFIAMFLYCFLCKRELIKIKLKDFVISALAGVSLAATAYTYYESMQMTSSSTAVVLLYLSPVPIMIISVLFLGERFNSKKALAVVLMLLGCAFVAGVIGDFKPDTLGVIMGLLSALLYTVYNVFNKIEAKRNVDPISGTLYTFMFGALFALTISEPWKIPSIIAEKPLFLIPVVITHSMVTCLFPFFLYTVSLKYLSVGIASSLSIIEPMTGALLGFIFYNDPLNVYKLIGIVFVISSVVLLGISENGEVLKKQKIRVKHRPNV